MELNIVADKNMPLATELFSRLGKVTTVSGRNLSNPQLKNADVLLVRSVTQVNNKLLNNTPVKFVGTATIGVDHVDLSYLKKQGIGFSAAPGCNANSVAEYILSALAASGRLEILLNKKSTLAIVGCGNVGSRLAYFAGQLGLNFICYDPPLQNSNAEKFANWGDWQQVLSSDVISLHVPFTKSGEYATAGMFGDVQFNALKPGCLLINSARGAVVDNLALLKFLNAQKQKPGLDVILDVWENEPDINHALRAQCLFGTMHIAGYSVDGKRLGTRMIFDAVAKYFQIDSTVKPPLQKPTAIIQWNGSVSFYQNLQNCIHAAVDICRDSSQLAQSDLNNLPNCFDLLRQNYPDRLEFSHYMINNIQPQYSSLMQALGFKIAATVAE